MMLAAWISAGWITAGMFALGMAGMTGAWAIVMVTLARSRKHNAWLWARHQELWAKYKALQEEELARRLKELDLT